MAKAPWFGELPKLYPDHYKHWHWMWDRITRGVCDTDLTRDKSGFLLFVEEIGEYTSDMKRPTVGRKDHSIGYLLGNFAWQENVDNIAEMSKRVGSVYVMIERRPKHRSEETKKILSEANIGKPWSEARRVAQRKRTLN